VLSDMASRLEDGKGHLSSLAECLDIISRTTDQRVRNAEIREAAKHLRAIFQLYHLEYKDAQTLRDALRTFNINV
jgi:hypothetical protein